MIIVFISHLLTKLYILNIQFQSLINKYIINKNPIIFINNISTLNAFPFHLPSSIKYIDCNKYVTTIEKIVKMSKL